VQWPHFDLMDQVFSHKPNTVPESIVDSLALTQREDNSEENTRSPQKSEVDEVDETLFNGNKDPDGTIATVTNLAAN